MEGATLQITDPESIPGSCAASATTTGPGRGREGGGEGPHSSRPHHPHHGHEAYRVLRSSDASCGINRGLRPVTRTGRHLQSPRYGASVKPPRLDAGCGRRGASALAELPCPPRPQDLDGAASLTPTLTTLLGTQENGVPRAGFLQLRPKAPNP